jgi:putative copper export protein
MMMAIRRFGPRRTGVIALAIATAAIGAVTFTGHAHATAAIGAVTFAGHAQAGYYWVGPFNTLNACKRERPKYKSSWTTPGPCLYYTVNPPGSGIWQFKVTTRY